MKYLDILPLASVRDFEFTYFVSIVSNSELDYFPCWLPVCGLHIHYGMFVFGKGYGRQVTEHTITRVIV